MKLSRNKRHVAAAVITQSLWLIVIFFALSVVTSHASDPSWWSSPGKGKQSAVVTPQVVTNAGVVTTHYIANDFAVVTEGQLKQFTARAVDALNRGLANSGGAGPRLNALVDGWAADYATNGYSSTNLKPSDFQVMKVGQLKYIADLVWGRLVASGYAHARPSWLKVNIKTDMQVANLGQLKTVFDFDFTRRSSPKRGDVRRDDVPKSKVTQSSSK